MFFCENASMTESLDLQRSPRRLRKNASVRALVQETRIAAEDLIQPLFVIDDNGPPVAIESMPGQMRLTIHDLVEECARLYQLGIRAVALFPSITPEKKNSRATEALMPDTLILRAVQAIRQTLPELVLIADIALDPYTDHGHDGVLNEEGTDVDNDATVEILCKMAVLHAEAGVDWVAPSDMMDGRIGAIRRTLDLAGYTETAILAYSAKYASAFYGPFRDAVGSSQAAGTKLLGKHTYQLNPANRREAATETELDEWEGADILMVKPAGPYLDIIRELRVRTILPVAAYQVSGEYAQIHAAAKKGWLELKATRDESLTAIKRAGADLILTYFAGEVAAELKGIMPESKASTTDYENGGGV